MDWVKIEMDLLPEYCHYHDGGCELAASCLNCPFPECIYVEPGGQRRWLKGLRDEEVCKLFTAQGKGIKDLAAEFGVSRRTIQRILKRSGAGCPEKISIGHERSAK